jgi:hypothetical protein
VLNNLYICETKQISMQTQNNEPLYCECCGAKLLGRWESVSKGLVKSLVKLKEQVIKTNTNSVHLKHLTLSKSEYNNFQKLRYHGLVARVKNQSGEIETGYWLLTKRGNLFLNNTLSIPKKVLIFRNSIVDRSLEATKVKDVLVNEEPYWFEKHDLEFQWIDVLDVEGDSSILSDENGQTKLF